MANAYGLALRYSIRDLISERIKFNLLFYVEKCSTCHASGKYVYISVKMGGVGGLSVLPTPPYTCHCPVAIEVLSTA